MPFEKFTVYSSPEATLKLWSRKLEYLFANLDIDNVSSTSLLGTDSVKDFMIDFGTGLQQVDALDVPIVDSTGAYSSTSVEGALEEISRLIRASSGDTVIDSTGNIMLESTNVLWRNAVWDDLRVSMTATKTAGIKDPGFIQVRDNGAGSPGVFAYGFDAAAQEELFFACQVPHTYKQDTDITAHVHWIPTSTDSGNVVWGLEYTWSNVNDTFGNTAILTAADASDLVIGKHQAVALDTITGTGKRESSMLVCRIFRDSTNATDTYPSDAALLEIDFHFLSEKLGTATPTYATT